MADNIVPFPDRGRSAAELIDQHPIDQRPDANDTITFTRDSLRPLTTAHPAMPRPSSGFDQIPWTDLVTRNFDGRG